MLPGVAAVLASFSELVVLLALLLWLASATAVAVSCAARRPFNADTLPLIGFALGPDSDPDPDLGPSRGLVEEAVSILMLFRLSLWIGVEKLLLAFFLFAILVTLDNESSGAGEVLDGAPVRDPAVNAVEGPSEACTVSISGR